ncbi:MAG: NAD(P)H-dependent flavin oxidoreductase [Gammaproteobacteria bacterium]
MTDILDRLHTAAPVWNAGMGGGLAGPTLAAAVSEAGGLGVLGVGGGLPRAAILAYVDETRRLTRRPFGANIILPMSDGSDIEACFDARVDVLVLFWGDPQPFLADARRRGIAVIAQCGGPDDAVAAADAGVDAVMVQGTEAGGHVKALAPLAETVPATVRALGRRIPVIAAGGLATGDDIATALGYGARAVSLGTRFLASTEAAAVETYKARLLTARAADTVFTDLFDIGWPRANHRVLRNATYQAWEAAGCPPPGARPGEGEEIGTIPAGDDRAPLPRYAVMPPMTGFEGDVDAAALYAGESVERIDAIAPAADLVRRLMEELRAAT